MFMTSPFALTIMTLVYKRCFICVSFWLCNCCRECEGCICTPGQSHQFGNTWSDFSYKFSIHCSSMYDIFKWYLSCVLLNILPLYENHPFLRMRTVSLLMFNFNFKFRNTMHQMFNIKSMNIFYDLSFTFHLLKCPNKTGSVHAVIRDEADIHHIWARDKCDTIWVEATYLSKWSINIAGLQNL